MFQVEMTGKDLIGIYEERRTRLYDKVEEAQAELAQADKILEDAPAFIAEKYRYTVQDMRHALKEARQQLDAMEAFQGLLNRDRTYGLDAADLRQFGLMPEGNDHIYRKLGEVVHTSRGTRRGIGQAVSPRG